MSVTTGQRSASFRRNECARLLGCRGSLARIGFYYLPKDSANASRDVRPDCVSRITAFFGRIRRNGRQGVRHNLGANQNLRDKQVNCPLAFWQG